MHSQQLQPNISIRENVAIISDRQKKLAAELQQKQSDHPGASVVDQVSASPTDKLPVSTGSGSQIPTPTFAALAAGSNITANNSKFNHIGGDQHNISNNTTTTNSNSGNVTTTNYTNSNNDSSIHQSVHSAHTSQLNGSYWIKLLLIGSGQNTIS